MTDVLKPRDANEVEDAVRWALGNDKALEMVGQGSKRALGRPSQTDTTLDLSGLTGVTLYEPAELVLSAQAGTPLAEIEALLDQNNQQLDFEPMDYGPLLGVHGGQGSIGGAIAANLSGPRRIKAGAARDHLLGVTAVSGRGETFKSGGRVVKNVTGYDLCKLLAGSWGTLARHDRRHAEGAAQAGDARRPCWSKALDDERACAAMTAAMGSSYDVSAAAHLPDHVASYFDGLPKPEAATVLRLEGVAPSVAHRKEALAALMTPFGPVAMLDGSDSSALWRSVRQVKPFAACAQERPVWRISTAPGKGHEIGAAITPAADVLRLGRRLIWAAMPFADEPDAGSIRARCRGYRRPRDAWCGRRRRCAPPSTSSSRKVPGCAP